MGFAGYYPLSAFREIADVCWWRASHPGARDADLGERRTAEDADAADRQRLERHEREVLATAIETHIGTLRGQGALGRAEGLRGRSIRLANAWNDVVDGKVGPDAWQLWHALGGVVTRVLVGLDEGRFGRDAAGAQTRPFGVHVAPDASRVEAAWAGICSRMDAGDFDQVDNHVTFDLRDGKTGARGVLVFEGWHARAMLFDEGWDLVPATDVEAIPLTVAEFDLPEGDLILTDYLRVTDPDEGFDKATDFGDREHGRDLDIGTELGRRNRTLAHAAEHHVGYVQTTNTRVVVHRQPGTGKVLVSERWGGPRGPVDADGDAVCHGWEKVGTFSGDMWRVTAVDAGTATRLLAGAGVPDAREALERYLASDEPYARNVVRAKVAPGRWRLHAGEDFSRRVNRVRLGIPRGIRPWMLLEPVTVGEA